MQTGQHLAERALHIPCSHTAFPAPTCRLFDLPKPSITSLQSQPTETTQYHPYAQYSLKKLQASLEAFRTSLPDSESRPNDVSTDPWWIFTRANLAAADMLFFAEYAVYQPVMFEHALNAAKRMVELVEGIRIETYAHLGRCSLDSRLIISQTWMRAVRCLDLELIFCRFLSLVLLHYCLVVNTFYLASLLIAWSRLFRLPRHFPCSSVPLPRSEPSCFGKLGSAESQRHRSGRRQIIASFGRESWAVASFRTASWRRSKKNEAGTGNASGVVS